MAHFRGIIEGNRGETSRLGTKTSGFYARIDGWNKGITVRAWYDEATDEDVFEVHRSGGSNNPAAIEFLGEW